MHCAQHASALCGGTAVGAVSPYHESGSVGPQPAQARTRASGWSVRGEECAVALRRRWHYQREQLGGGRAGRRARGAAQRLTLGGLQQGATWPAARGARPRLREARGSIYEGTAPCVAGGCGLGPAESAASLAMPRANASRRRGSPGARDPPSCGAAAVQYTAISVARTKKARMFPSSSRRHVADGSWIAVQDFCYASAVFCKTLLMA